MEVCNLKVLEMETVQAEKRVHLGNLNRFPKWLEMELCNVKE